MWPTGGKGVTRRKKCINATTSEDTTYGGIEICIILLLLLYLLNFDSLRSDIWPTLARRK